MIKTAYILCGGKGTRLGSLTRDKPKPLLITNNKPFLHYLINELVIINVNRIILCTGYLSEQFNDFIKIENKRFDSVDIKISIMKEDKPLGTFGNIINNLNNLMDDFIVLNGDTLFRGDKNLSQIIRKYSESKMSVMKISHTMDASRYGRIITNPKNKLIVELEEKPREKIEGYINTGFYIFRKNDLIDFKNLFKSEKDEISLEKDYIPYLIKKKKIVGVTSDNNIFLDIGIEEDFNKSSDFISKNMKKKVLICDRDNTLNEDQGYTHKIKDLKLMKKNINYIKKISESYDVILVATNQSGIDKKYYTKEQMQVFNEKLTLAIEKIGVKILGFYYCPHDPIISGKCKCRKPETGLIEQINEDWIIDKENTLMVGDKTSDIIAGRSYGVNTYRV